MKEQKKHVTIAHFFLGEAPLFYATKTDFLGHPISFFSILPTEIKYFKERTTVAIIKAENKISALN